MVTSCKLYSLVCGGLIGLFYLLGMAKKTLCPSHSTVFQFTESCFISFFSHLFGTNGNGSGTSFFPFCLFIAASSQIK